MLSFKELCALKKDVLVGMANDMNIPSCGKKETIARRIKRLMYQKQNVLKDIIDNKPIVCQAIPENISLPSLNQEGTTREKENTISRPKKHTGVMNISCARIGDVVRDENGTFKILLADGFVLLPITCDGDSRAFIPPSIVRLYMKYGKSTASLIRHYFPLAIQGVVCGIAIPSEHPDFVLDGAKRPYWTITYRMKNNTRVLGYYINWFHPKEFDRKMWRIVSR